jgi:uncharacterized protein GlcG (DUF336 family)
VDKKRWNLANLILVGSIAISATPALAQSVLNERQISLGLAREAANAAINQCRKDGYQVSVTVVDRSGQVKVMMRDDNSGPHTPDTSRRKAYTALTFRTSTTELANRVASNPSAANLRDITDIILLAGGLPIRAGNEVIGGIGVGGAPGGDRDEVCAKAGIDKISN